MLSGRKLKLLKKIRLPLISLLMLFATTACTLRASITDALTTNVYSAPTLTSPQINDGNDLSSFPIAGSCPNGASTVVITINSISQNFTCNAGSFSGTVDLSLLPEGSHTISIAPNVGPSAELNLTIDLTPPSPPSLLAIAEWYNSTTSTPPVLWTASTDSLSGVDHYEVRLIKDSDSSVVQDWISLASGSPLSGLSLTNNVAYHFEARAIDRAGNISSPAASTSFKPDTVLPSITALSWYESATPTASPQYSWQGSGGHSGINYYEISFGQSAGAQDVMPWTQFNPISSPIISPTYMGVFASSRVYYVNIRAFSIAGNVSSIYSQSWTLPHLLTQAVALNDRTPYMSLTPFNETIRGFLPDTIATDKKYVFGTFIGVSSGSAAPKLVRLNSDGTRDMGFDIGSGFNGPVLAITLQGDGKILVGGDFTLFNGTSANYLVR